jgi:hypothetical protein
MVWHDIPAEVVGNKAATARLAHQFAAIFNVRTKILRMTVHAERDFGDAYSTQNFTSNVKSGGPGLNFNFVRPISSSRITASGG